MQFSFSEERITEPRIMIDEAGKTLLGCRSVTVKIPCLIVGLR